MEYRAHLTALLLLVAACGKDGHDDHDQGAHAEGAREEHAARNGGELLELGAHEGHVEAKFDHSNGVLAVWLWNDEMKPWTADQPPVINFTVDGKPISLRGEGEGAEWMFRHEALKREPENMRLRVAAGGATYQAVWEHDHD